jgi:N-dimethylarginine dimethylaminohydrolase
MNKQEFIEYLKNVLEDTKEVSPFDTDEECHIKESFSGVIEDIIQTANSIEL